MARGIEAACWGTATKDGELRQSKAGNDFGIVNIAVSEGPILGAPHYARARFP